MSIIVYELNEVPKKLFNFFALSHPDSAFAKLRNHSAKFETFTADIGHLSPWITWPTMHRGVSNIHHEISDLGQDLKFINKEYPSIFNILAKEGIKVGVFGSLHTYPLPEDLNNYAFYVPDTFAASDDCYPENLNDFQAFNLAMVRANGRNVSSGIALRNAVQFLRKSISLGLTTQTFIKLSNQLISERINSDRLTRRRTSQVEIAFDLFMRQLNDTQPHISFFFTNHLASSMHRYWPTIFPNDYEDGKFDEIWRKRWSGEIPHAVKIANFQLQKLLDFCDYNSAELIVCSSMGQAAVKDVEPVEKQVLITNVSKLMNYLGLTRNDWEPRLSMAPLVMISPKSGSVIGQLDYLKNININGEKISWFQTSSGDIRLEIHLCNQGELFVVDDGRQIDPHQIGISNVSLQDASGSYAYHIPQGVLLHYKKRETYKKDTDEKWMSASVLDFAPSLLKKFNKDVPSYMQNDSLLF